MNEEKKRQFHELYNIGEYVFKTLGDGFKEEVYQDAVEKELISHDIIHTREKHLVLHYKCENGKTVELPHSFRPDFYCYDSIVLELKAQFLDQNAKIRTKQQIENYMRATKSNYAMLLNFYGSKMYNTYYYEEEGILKSDYF